LYVVLMWSSDYELEAGSIEVEQYRHNAPYIAVSCSSCCEECNGTNDGKNGLDTRVCESLGRKGSSR
jgi:hypothetical protein